MRFFNTAGPVRPAEHYYIPPLERLAPAETLLLIDQGKYFVLYAPRQTGKTSALLALLAYLNTQGHYRCVYINVEIAQAARENVAAAMQAILGELGSRARILLKDTFVNDCWPDVLVRQGPFQAFGEMLTRWCEHDPRPLVLLIDEIDSLVGDTLIAVLRQLHSGYPYRPPYFPQSIILCGIRDVRDYRIHSSQEKSVITGGSAFNIKAASLQLGDFSPTEVEKLYQQHTDETGQVFQPDALAKVWELTQGQPWLINALAYEVTHQTIANRDGRAITVAMIEQAKENLILRRETHLDQLADKLQEERVRRIIGPLLASDTLAGQFRQDDVSYLVDLGLIRQEIGGLVRIANPIYQEVIPRELVWPLQAGLSEQRSWYINADYRLDLAKLLAAFQVFFREHSEHWVERFQYKEAGPQLLLQAFLQRIVNGGGRIEREYGLGMLRTDLLVIWQAPAGVQKAVIELKLLHKSLQQTVAQGLQQTLAYWDRCAADEAHLVIFDRTPTKSWEDKLFQRQETVAGKVVMVWGM